MRTDKTSRLKGLRKFVMEEYAKSFADIIRAKSFEFSPTDEFDFCTFDDEYTFTDSELFYVVEHYKYLFSKYTTGLRKCIIEWYEYKEKSEENKINLRTWLMGYRGEKK